MNDRTASELGEFLQEYHEAFVAALASGDASALTALRTDPFTIVPPGAPPVVTEGEERLSSANAACNRLKAGGLASEVLHGSRVRSVDDSAAVIEADFGWIDDEGDEYLRPQATLPRNP